MAFSGLTRLFRLAVRPPGVEQDVDAEIGFHLDEEARALMARGLSPDAARLEAGTRFGDIMESRAEMARLIGANATMFGIVDRILVRIPGVRLRCGRVAGRCRPRESHSGMARGSGRSDPRVAIRLMRTIPL